MGRRQRLVDRRNSLRLTQAALAERIGCDVGTLRRYENGDSTPRSTDWPALAEAYRWGTAQVALALSDEPPPAVNGHAPPSWLGHLAGIEQSAARLAAWEPLVIHGLMQTADYALAVEQADATPKSEEAIVRRVQSRLGRQTALDRPEPLRLSMVLDESVLHRVAGGRAVMAGQLDHLAALADRANVDLRVLPLDAGQFSGGAGAFWLFVQPGAVAPWMAVTEDRAGPHYHDADHHPQAVAAHVSVFDHLTAHSLDPDSTVDLIHRIAKEYR